MRRNTITISIDAFEAILAIIGDQAEKLNHANKQFAQLQDLGKALGDYCLLGDDILTCAIDAAKHLPRKEK